MKKIKVCVTGASGFIGRRLVSSLNQQGYELNVLSRKANTLWPPGVKLIKGDLTSAECPLEQLVKGCDIVYHCAGELHKPDSMKRLHVDGTQRLLNAVLDEAKRCEKAIHWVQLSSVGVYGPPRGRASEQRVVTEASPILPQGEYETTKALSDSLVIKAAQTGLLTYSIIRPSNVLGPDMPSNALRSLVRAIHSGIFFHIGRGDSIATYVHVDDVVELLSYCGVEECAKGDVVNISNDCPLHEMIESIALVLGVTPPRLRLPEPFTRGVIYILSRIITLPLTQEGINVLVARTEYPSIKLRQYGFIPAVHIPQAMNEIVPENLKHERL